MATAAQPVKPQSSDKSGRSKLFTWMKRFSKSKQSSKKYNGGQSPQKANGLQAQHDEVDGTPMHDRAPAPMNHSDTQTEPMAHANGGTYLSYRPTEDGMQSGHEAARPGSTAPTLDTNPGTTKSDSVLTDGDRHSKAGNSGVLTGGMSTVSGGGGTSIFSSSNHSSRSLSTTLTTIQSAPSNAIHTIQQHHGASQLSQNTTANHSSHPSQSSTYFSHQYPTAPASAVPPYLNPSSHLPTTYRSATANNLLTDNASVLTLASSRQGPQRRNSVDTNASIRAIAPSSVWGGSRESLPLSLLSHNADATGYPTPPSTANLTLTTSNNPRSIPGLERASVYSATGPALSSERNSLYAAKTREKDREGDGASSMHDNRSVHDRMSLKASSVHTNERFDNATSANSANSAKEEGSVRSGHTGHGRNDSITGSIGTQGSKLKE